MILIVLLFLSIIFISSIYASNKCFGAPAVIFSASFLFSGMWAYGYAGAWNRSLQWNTSVIIVTCVFLFVFTCVISSHFHRRLKYYSNYKYANIDLDYEYINIDKWKVIAYLIIEILIITIYARQIIRGSNSLLLSDAINSVYMGRAELSLPLHIRILLAVIRGGGYWFSYVIVVNFLKSKKIEWLMVIIVVLSMIATSLAGSRGTSICLLLSFPAYVLILSYRNNRFNRSIKIKYIISGIILIIILLWIFPRIKILLGRGTSSSGMNHVAVYVGAEFFNLDRYLNSFDIPTNTGTFASLTFSSLETTLAKYFGFTINKPYMPYPYIYSNGLFLGNVYTVLYVFLYDFGYLGSLVAVALYAWFCQIVFDKASTTIIDNKIPISVLIYGYLFGLLTMSFFSWWAGNYIFSTAFIYIILTWVVFNKFFIELNFCFKRN